VALEILTGLLAAAALVYAGFAGWAAWEMRETRRLSIRPKLALQVLPHGLNHGHLALTNLGPGAALEVDVMLTFEPLGESRPWRTDILVPGERAEFMFPSPAVDAPPFNFADLERENVRVLLEGSARDVGWNKHAVRDEVDASAWSSTVERSRQLYVKPPMQRIGDELERIRNALESRQAET
jgi:hypothetical protein